MPGEALTTLAIKLSLPKEMTQCAVCFVPSASDDLFSGLFKSSKKKRHLICYKRDHTKQGDI